MEPRGCNRWQAVANRIASKPQKLKQRALQLLKSGVNRDRDRVDAVLGVAISRVFSWVVGEAAAPARLDSG